VANFCFAGEVASLFCRRGGRLGQWRLFPNCWPLLLPPSFPARVVTFVLLVFSITGACLGPTVTLGADFSVLPFLLVAVTSCRVDFSVTGLVAWL